MRAITRNPESPAAQALAARGVEVVRADLSSLEETAAAFAGAWGVFGLTQFYVHGYEGEQLHGRNIVDRKSTRLNSSHSGESRMPSSA